MRFNNIVSVPHNRVSHEKLCVGRTFIKEYFHFNVHEGIQTILSVTLNFNRIFSKYYSSAEGHILFLVFIKESRGGARMCKLPDTCIQSNRRMVVNHNYA
jgi:hypothetical protein